MPLLPKSLFTILWDSYKIRFSITGKFDGIGFIGCVTILFICSFVVGFAFSCWVGAEGVEGCLLVFCRRVFVVNKTAEKVIDA